MKSFVICLLVLLFCVLPVQAAEEQVGGDFTLTDQDGATFHLQDLRGKVVLLFFGYTHCPDVCPDSLGKIARVLRELERQSGQVRGVFISVDPERDTVEKLAQYVPFFSPLLVGLTGTPDQIRQVADAYHADFKAQKNAGKGDFYTLDHTASIYLLDREGRVNSIIPYGLPAEHILAQVQKLLGGGTGTAAVPRLLDAIPDQQQAPAAQLRDMDGRPYRLQAHVGRIVMINFWASWCPPCREELPAMNRAYRALANDGITMLAVNVGERQEAVSRFLQDYPIDFPVLLDEAGASMQQWPIRGLPTTFILDASGNMVYRASGEREWDNGALLEQIRGLLGKAPG